MFSLLTAAALAQPLHARWSLDEGVQHRWVTETEVQFPGHLWLYADRNLDVRAHRLGLQLVVDCTVDERRRNEAALACSITDAAATGASFPGQHDRLQLVLEEIDAKLTGAPLQLVISDRGRVSHLEVELNQLASFENRRTRDNDQIVRMMVVRALAPLDLKLPATGLPTDGSFDASSRLATQVPVTVGSNGKIRFAHQAEQVAADQVLIHSEGKGTLVPGGFLEPGSLVLDTTLEGQTAFDLDAGRVSEALWFTRGRPTGTSGPLARPYGSYTLLRALEPGEEPTITETRVTRPGDS